MLTIRAGFIGVGVELVVGFQTSARVCSHCSFDSKNRLKLYYSLVYYVYRSDCMGLGIK